MNQSRLFILMVMAALVMMVTGCGNTHSYDNRLVAADNLIAEEPDSALTLLESLPTGSMPAEADRAYHGLLLAQARYKAYITATSDSDINRALSYYRNHPSDREKLTRSYIYKGAVMEELGHPDSAMYYYKTAEATAVPDDYFNLGYVKYRMGYLYGSFYAMDGKDLEKYEEAVECFSHTNDTVYQIQAMNNLGCLYRETKPEEAMATFNKAMDLARQTNDTAFICAINHSKVVLLFYQGKYDEARRLIQEALHYQPDGLGRDFCFEAANVYSRLRLVDSARVFINSALQYNHEDALGKMYHLVSLSELALARNDSITYLKYAEESQAIADSLKSNQVKPELFKIENDYDKALIDKNLNSHRLSRIILMALIAVALLAMILGFWWHHRKVHRYDQLINELRKEAVETDVQQEVVIKSMIVDQRLRNFITEHTSLMREVIEECYHAPNSVLSKNIQRIVKYQETNRDAWINLFSYIDMENNNIMTETKKNFPQLEEKELLMVALTSMGYSCAQIAIIMGYSSAAGIGTMRNRVAKKMGIDCTLVEYVDQFTANNH
jgi:tetratricopeptide (TPR) repeat protein